LTTLEEEVFMIRSGKVKRAVSSVLAAVLLTATAIIPRAALAQTASTGVITGVVQNEKGEVVPNAIVRAVNMGTNAAREAKTSGEGVYEITQLAPGNYRIEVEAAGFSKSVEENVTVNVLQRTTINPTLKVGAVTEIVNVTAENQPLVETTKTDVSGVVDQRRLENLPVNGRSFASLAILIPGATLAPSFDPTKARVGTFSIGGSSGRNLNITVDGGDNKDNAVGGILQNFSMEGIQEFALSTQRFSAANGRSGGALLSVISKSGTNNFHGSLFGFFRDDKLNANAPALLAKANNQIFAPGDAVKPPFSRQQFGGSIGGPIKKDKAFFFGTVERTRERGNSIVSSTDQAQIAALTSFGYQAVRFLPQPFNDWQYTVKGDFNINSKHTLVTRFAGQNNNALNDQAGFLVVRTDLSGGNKTLNTLYSFLANETWTVSTSAVNQFIYQYSTFDNQILATTDLNNLTFPSGIAVGRNGNVPQETIQKKHQFRDDLTYNRGNHGFKFGADFVWEPTLGGIFAFTSAPEYDFQFDPLDIANNPGQFPQGFRTHQVLPGNITCPTIVGTATCTAAQLAGAGVVADIVLAGGDPSFNLRDGAKQFAWYVQDDWKINPRFTLNIGVRYDVDIGFLDSGHQASNRAIRALQIIGSPYGGVAKDDKNNFSPRIGFAWDIKGNARSVLRGGYGIYFDQSFLNVPLFAVQQANPEIYASFLNDNDNLAIDSPPPSVPRPLSNPLPGSRGRIIDPHFVAPYTQQWNAGYAQEIGKNMALEFDYVHILGLHEFTSLDINPRTGPLHNAQRSQPASAFPRVLAPLFAAHAAELLAAFGTSSPFARITAAQSVGRSRYDAFTVAFRRRYANKFQLNAHYTLSKSRAWFGQASDFGNQAQNVFDQWNPENFGPTDADERHRFVASGIFDLKWGFQVAPIFQIASPRAYSIFPSCGCDINRDGVTVDRDSVNPGVDDQHHLPLNNIRGDNFQQLNVRVSKFFNFGEQRKLGLFFEAFNVFNTANFGREFQNTTGAADFGKPLNFFGATGFSEPLGIPFQAQLGARFSF
jgi:hypothetical protein